MTPKIKSPHNFLARQPWIATSGIVLDDDDNQICQCYGDAADDHARLFAAAPGLLAACKRLRTIGDTQRTLDAIDAAIAAAEWGAE